MTSVENANLAHLEAERRAERELESGRLPPCARSRFDQMYELVVVLHILAAIAWIGSGFLLILGFGRIRSAEGPAAVDQTMVRMEPTTSLIFVVAPPVVLLTGIGMVLWNEAWDFSQVWVYLALGLFVVTAILGGGVSGRMEKEMKEARESGTDASDVLARFLKVGWLEMVILVAIVALMVYKPI